MLGHNIATNTIINITHTKQGVVLITSLLVQTDYDLLQQTREGITICFHEALSNSMISLLNMSTASAPIQNTAAIVKYWMVSDMMVQMMSFSIRSIPTRKNSSMQIMEIECWV